MVKRKKLSKKESKFTRVVKSVKYKPKLSKSLLRYADAFGRRQSSNPKGAGRPKAVFKHTSPFSNKPISAPQYYKEMRLFKRLQARKVEDMKEQQLRDFAKRGIPPSQIQNYQQFQRLQQLQLAQQQAQQQANQVQATPQVQRPIPNQNHLQDGQVIPAGTRVWKFRRGVVGTEGGLFGRQQKVYGLPSSFWN